MPGRGRTADQLYWVARYTERAENMARLLDVSHRMSLMLPPGPAQLSTWASALEVAGDAGDYEERYGEIAVSKNTPSGPPEGGFGN